MKKKNTPHSAVLQPSYDLAATTPIELPADVLKMVLNLIENNKKIDAIKLVRDKANVDLSSAKIAIENPHLLVDEKSSSTIVTSVAVIPSVNKPGKSRTISAKSVLDLHYEAMNLLMNVKSIVDYVAHQDQESEEGAIFDALEFLIEHTNKAFSEVEEGLMKLEAIEEGRA